MKTRSRLLTIGLTVALSGATVVSAAPAMANPLSQIAAQQAISKINSTACPTGAEREKALRTAHSYKIYSYGAAKAVAAKKAQQRFDGFTAADLDRVATAGANAAQRCNLIVSPGGNNPAPAPQPAPAPAPAPRPAAPQPAAPAPQPAPAPAPSAGAPGAPATPEQLVMWAQTGNWDQLVRALGAAVQQFLASLHLPQLPTMPQLPPLSS